MFSFSVVCFHFMNLAHFLHLNSADNNMFEVYSLGSVLSMIMDMVNNPNGRERSTKTSHVDVVHDAIH